MEKFLLKAVVVDYSMSKNALYAKWAEGYLNLVALTNEGPVFNFAEMAEDKINYLGPGECRSFTPTLYSGYVPETVSRWTGLYDKNGKKIFEGDIIQFHKWRWNPDWIGEVQYQSSIGLFMIVGNMPDDEGPFEIQLSGIDKDTIEIVGNIWGDPSIFVAKY